MTQPIGGIGINIDIITNVIHCYKVSSNTHTLVSNTDGLLSIAVSDTCGGYWTCLVQACMNIIISLDVKCNLQYYPATDKLSCFEYNT